MCTAIEYQGRQIWFREPNAKLPVVRKDGTVGWCRWGLSFQDHHVYFHNGPSIAEHVLGEEGWQLLSPKPVRLAVDRYLITDREGQEHWFSIDPRSAMRGILVKWKDDIRVYILTERASSSRQSIRSQWPKFRKAMLEEA
ncbi:hypothetical protein [Chitinimonas naiadis]